jgi:hypothetical protein
MMTTMMNRDERAAASDLCLLPRRPSKQSMLRSLCVRMPRNISLQELHSRIQSIF